MFFFLWTKERILNSRGKRAISVRATEVLLYWEECKARRPITDQKIQYKSLVSTYSKKKKKKKRRFSYKHTLNPIWYICIVWNYYYIALLVKIFKFGEVEAPNVITDYLHSCLFTEKPQ